MKIYFLLIGKESAYIFSKMFQVFQKRGMELKVFTISKWDYNYYKHAGLDAVYVPKFLSKNKISNVESKLAEIEKKFDICYLRNLITGDRETQFETREQSYLRLYRYLEYWIGLFKKDKPDAMVTGCERFFYMSCQEIAKEFKIPCFIQQTFLPFINYHNLHFYMGNNRDKYILPELDEYWEKNKNRKLTSDEQKRAQEYVDSITKNINKNPLLFETKPQVSWRLIKFFSQTVYQKLFIEEYKLPTLGIKRGLKNYILKYFRSRFVSHLCDKPDWNDKIVYFPMHDPDDAQLLVGAQHYVNQFNLIEEISKNIPIDYTLYVKEHPNVIGMQKFSNLKKIKSLPNVKLIHPYVSSKLIAQKCKLITVINSRAGFEGILFNKPVLVFGRTFYQISGLCKLVRDLYHLSDSVHEVLNHNPVDKEKLLRFINALYNVPAYHGNLWINSNLYHISGEDNTKELLEDKNINSLSDGLWDILHNKLSKKQK